MSKSLGNLHTIEELAQKGYKAQEARSFFCQGAIDNLSISLSIR